MRILCVLTYYRPHTSGLTIYAERLAKALVRRGHEVTIFTSQFDPATSKDEIVDGVRIIRTPVIFRISKGVFMPYFGFMATKLVKETDIVHLHLPQFDAPGVALRGRIFKKPAVTTYHSDLFMPPGFFNRIINIVIDFMNELSAKITIKIVASTEDFSINSKYLSRYLKKVHVILPPIELPDIDPNNITEFKLKNNPDQKRPVIGMATRFAAEKGVEVLLDALPKVIEKNPNALVLFAGEIKKVFAEEAYIARLMPRIKEYQENGHWRFVGNLTQDEMAAYYPGLDVLLVPSLNSTESFGLVQIEAMINGVPCVASDLPGVRQPVKMTGMGQVVPIGDSEALAKAINEIVNDKESYQGDSDAIRKQFSSDSIAENYEKLFTSLLDEL